MRNNLLCATILITTLCVAGSAMAAGKKRGHCDPQPVSTVGTHWPRGVLLKTAP
jgi:hypothetical protein